MEQYNFLEVVLTSLNPMVYIYYHLHLEYQKYLNSHRAMWLKRQIIWLILSSFSRWVDKLPKQRIIDVDPHTLCINTLKSTYKRTHNIHSLIQEFSSGGGGGGGGPGQSDKKALGTFFGSLAYLFYRSKMVNFKENYHFYRFLRAPTFSRGGGGGVQLLIPFRNPYNLWFSRGSGPPCPPLDPHLTFLW